MDDNNLEIQFISWGRELSFLMKAMPGNGNYQDLCREVKAYNVCEPEVFHVIIRALRENDIFIDGGANIGFFTLLARTLGAFVVAYEPAMENMVALQENFAFNNMNGAAFCASPLWSDERIMTFNHSAENSGRHSFGEIRNKKAEIIAPGWTEPMKTTTLNHMAPTPRMIKLDIEGAEEQALRGATNHLKDQACPYIICEMNWTVLQSLGSCQQSLREFMREQGYTTFLLHKDGSYPSQLPHDVEIEPKYLNCNILFSTPDKVHEIWPRTPIV